MAKEYYPLLPKLREDAAVNPDKASVWEEGTYDFLTALVKSLDVGSTIKDIGHIDSIPDVWARPLLFQMALYDKQGGAANEFVSGLHDRVVGEWRALLAMIALKDIRHLDLTAEPVPLENDDSGLAQVLKALAPQETIDPETTWSNLSVLYFQGKPIGITSPTTLVSAAADYMTAFGGQLPQPWSTDGVMLTDPLPYLTGEEVAALAFWLERTHDYLLGLHGSERNEAYNNLLHAVESYRSAAATRAEAGRTYELVENDLATNSRAFRCLKQSVKGREATAEDSAVRLVPSAARSPKCDVLLVSPEMVRSFAENAAVPAAQLVVWPGVSANDVTDDSLAGARDQIGAVQLADAIWRRPEEFFTEQMTLTPPDNACPASYDIAGMKQIGSKGFTPVLPIRPELLELFTPEEIAQRLSLDMKGRSVTMTFQFPVSGVHGVTNYTYTKVYDKSAHTLVTTTKKIPVVELWPNFRREGWSKYYMYYENTESVNGGGPLANHFLYVVPWYPEKHAADGLPAGGLANRYLARLDGFPEAIACSIIPSDDPQAQPVPAGMFLLVPPPVAPVNPELLWNLGIDFGTSSTMLYYRANQHDPAPLAFDPHLYQVLDSGTSRLRTFSNFIGYAHVDKQQDDGSFLSIFHLLSADSLKGDAIRPLQDGNIFSLMLSEQYLETFGMELDRIDTNLKWQDDAIGRRKVAAYIQQLCLQSLAEAAAHGAEHVAWNFSFPTAFSSEQQIAFLETCREAVRETCKGTCFRSEDVEITSWPESKASAYHFNKLGGSETNFGDGAICLDIGAGTTDISIISKQPGEIVYHTSIQFAGRYLFRPIYRAYDLFAGKQVAFLADARKNGAISDTIIDADMRLHSAEYLKNLKNLTGKAEVKTVLQHAQLAMAGIFYYLGGMLGVLAERGIYQENHVPDIFVGGNGSRIFSWLSGGTFLPESPFVQVFQDMLATASGLADGRSTGIHLSAQPKIEVAAGMIEERPQNDADFFNEAAQTHALFGEGKVDDYTAASVIAGDAYVKDGGMQTPETFLSAHDITAGITVQELPVLRRFLKDFDANHHIWGEGVEFPADTLSDIEKRVNNYYVAEKGKDIKKIYVEPVFVMGLKKMMEAIDHAD